MKKYCKNCGEDIKQNNIIFEGHNNQKFLAKIKVTGKEKLCKYCLLDNIIKEQKEK